jgi:hypothetical protein
VRGAPSPEKNEMASELRGRQGAAEDRRRWGFAEGGAVRRSRERRRPRATVAGGPAGGGCGGGASSGVWRWRQAVRPAVAARAERVLEYGGGASLLLPLRWAVGRWCSSPSNLSSRPLLPMSFCYRGCRKSTEVTVTRNLAAPRTFFQIEHIGISCSALCTARHVWGQHAWPDPLAYSAACSVQCSSGVSKFKSDFRLIIVFFVATDCKIRLVCVHAVRSSLQLHAWRT